MSNLEKFASIPQKRYLGDGVYASFDGYQIILRANVPTTDTIFIEPSVLRNLNEYWKLVQDTMTGGKDE
jgi:hypothetical protein